MSVLIILTFLTLRTEDRSNTSIFVFRMGVTMLFGLFYVNLYIITNVTDKRNDC